MKPNQNPDDPNLGRVLRDARDEPPLPPRFQEGVWRRIAEAESPVRNEANVSWLDALVTLVLRPRFAVATATVLVVFGAVLGARQGNLTARHEAQTRYVATVAPGMLR